MSKRGLLNLKARRVLPILSVGVEKCVLGDLTDLAVRMNAPGSAGHRLSIVKGMVSVSKVAPRPSRIKESEILLMEIQDILGSKDDCRYVTKEELMGRMLLHDIPWSACEILLTTLKREGRVGMIGWDMVYLKNEVQVCTAQDQAQLGAEGTSFTSRPGRLPDG